MDDMLVQADEMQTTIDTMTRMIAADGTDERDDARAWWARCNDMTVDVAELRDDISRFR